MAPFKMTFEVCTSKFSLIHLKPLEGLGTMKLLLLILLSTLSPCFSNDKISIGTKDAKRSRTFSIFHVINFPNSQCTILSTANTNLVMYGTCVSFDTCSSKKGTADGNCASGFGVCCMYTVSTCGSTISQNLTYIQNPGYPGSFASTGACQYNFQSSSDVCQIRLDYDVNVVANPDTTTGFVGSCTSANAVDSVVVTSPSGYNPPTVCGFNSGQHIYLETGREVNAGSIAFKIGSSAITQTRSWKIRVSQIECISNYRAPQDCLQYLTGTTGKFKTFNFQLTSPQVLQSQDYNVCIRQEEGYCSINFSVDNTIPSANVFKLDQAPANTAKRQGCSTLSYITIRAGVNLTPAPPLGKKLSNIETFCGSALNRISGATSNGVVPSTQLPFIVGVFGSSGTMMLNTNGAALQYAQAGC